MTVIFTTGDFWIEDLNVLSSSIPANSNTSVGLGLERPGHCVGIAAVITNNTADEALASQIYTVVRNQSTGGTIVYGQVLSSVGIRRGNNSASAISFGVHVIIFMRR